MKTLARMVGFAALLLAGLAQGAVNVEFGSAVVGGTAATVVLNLSSQDASPLNVTALNFSDPQFAVVNPKPPFTIPGNGGQLAVTLQFVPAAAGDVNATLTLVDPPHPSQTYNLHGAGVTGSVSGPTIDFGTVVLGGSSTRTFSLSDPNSVPLNVTSITSTNPEFTVTTTPPFTINPGAQQTITMNFSPVAGGTQTSVLTIVSAGAQNLLLNLTGVGQAGPPPQINSNGVSNAAVAKNTLARGGLAAVYGANFAVGSATFQAPSLPLPTSLGGVSITVGGVPAPLYFVSSGQINFQVPFEVSGSSANVVVTVNGAASPPVNVAIADYAVGVFGSASSPVALHIDNSFVTPTNPGVAGETVILYATGIGKLNNAPGDGAAASTTPLVTAADTPTASIGGVNAPVLFAGLTPGGVGLSQFDITLPSSLPSSPSGTLPLVINFPGDSGPAVDLAVKSNAQGSPKLSLSSTSLAFGNVNAGQTSVLLLTLNNTGSSTLVVSALTTSGVAFSLVSAPQTPFTIAAGGSQTLSVRFTASGPGQANGSLSIVTNDASSPATVSFSGTGVTTGTPAVSVSVSSLDFGSLTVGQSKDATLTITNTGNAPLALNSLTAAAPFSVLSPATPLNIAAGIVAVVTVHFAPTAGNSYSGPLTISTNDPARATVVVSLTGVGVAVPPGASAIGVTPASLTFGNVTVGQSSTLALKVSNTGTAPLTVTSLTVTAGFKVVSPATPFNLAVGAAATTVTISFTPATTGPVSGTLTIASNDPNNGSLTVTLTGAGAAQIPLACGFTLGPDIYAKWTALGGAGGLLGCPTASESEAAKSPQGTTGRTAPFAQGLIYWHRDGIFAGQAYEMHGCTVAAYTSLALSGSSFGFPTSDQYAVNAGYRNDFQGGYILGTAGFNFCSIFGAGSDFSGNWNTDRGPMNLVQDSFDISGTYGNQGTVLGNISGINASLTWQDASGLGLAALTLASDAQSFTGTFSKQGSGTNAQWNGTRTAGGTVGWFSPSFVNFGTVVAGQSKTLNVVAVGEGSPLTVIQFSSDNPAFQVTVGGFTALPGNSIAIAIRFTPNATGTVSGNITVSTLDPARPSTIIKVTGTGQ